MSDKTYVGKGWQHDFKNGGHVLNISIRVKDLPEPDQYGNVRLVVGKRKSPDEKTSATHWVALDDWKPEKKKETIDRHETDLPF